MEVVPAIVPALPYRHEPVGTFRQRAVFVTMQTVFFVTFLWLSSTVLSLLLSQFVTPTTVLVVLVTTCVFTTLWQLAYVYRILAMRRTVLVDPAPPKGLRIAMATTLVPSREFDLLEAKLAGMAQVDPCGNQLDHWVLDEEDDPRVRSLIDKFNQLYLNQNIRFHHFTRKGIPRYNETPTGRQFKTFQARQKGGNINAWLDSARGAGYDLITFMDLDHVPKVGFYRAVLPYFRDPDVAFVQGPESFHNRDENFITRAASLERDTFFGLIHRSYYGLDMPVIVGAHTTFRAETFEALGGYYPVHLTEDYLIMLRLRALGKRGIYVDEVLAVGELPSTWTAYLGQQLRWASGGLDLLIRFFPGLWRDYTNKERLFTFSLLNYYAWGTFFVVSKALLFGLLLGGIVLRLDTPLVACIVVFTLVAMFANHLWERQFFIETDRRTYLLQNAVMNNFLGGLYFLSLFKAVVAPNTAFQVTAKSGAQNSNSKRGFSYPITSGILLVIEIVGLTTALAWASPLNTAPETSGYNILVFPLMLSVAANLFILVAYRKHESTIEPGAVFKSGGADADILETAGARPVGITSLINSQRGDV